MLMLALTLSYTSCAKNDSNTETDDAQTSSEKLIPYDEAFRQVLEENEEAILDYNWQNAFQENVPEYGPTALCDIDEDGIPELFYMATTDIATAYMHICKYEDGSVIDLEYKCEDGFTGSTNKMLDANAAAGTTFMVYKCKEKNRFNIYHGFGDESYWYIMDEFELEGNIIKRVETLSDHFITKGNENWYRNDEEISESEFLNYWKATKEDMDTDNIIMFSIHAYEEDVSHFKLLHQYGSKCVSYEKMIKQLTE